MLSYFILFILIKKFQLIICFDTIHVNAWKNIYTCFYVSLWT